jgi:hypothetical protein
MDKAIVERAVRALAALNAGSSAETRPAPAPAPAPSRADESKREEHGSHWPPESLDAERRFGQSHAKLFPFLGRKVRTPEGAGMLVQVFADRVTVLLDTEREKCAWFEPGRVEPVSWELA